MKNPVIFRVRENRPTQIACIAVVFALLSIFSSIATSCKKTAKGRIEQKFEEYVNKKFANPSDFIKITSIELEDSLNIREMCESYLTELSPDSIDSKVSEEEELMSSLANKVPVWFKRNNREYVLQLISSEGAYIRLRPIWNKLKEEYGKVDSLNLIDRYYVIKAQVKENNSNVIKEFYATDYMIVDSLVISDKKIMHKDSPREVLVLCDALESYIKAVKIRLDFLEELRNFNDKQMMVAM